MINRITLVLGGMRKFESLQIVGPLALFCAVGAAECAAYGLSSAPSSEWMWYLNLKLFGMFQQSHYTASEYLGLERAQLLLVALPLFAMGCAGIAFRRSLLLALSSNLSFVYIGFVFYG